MKCRASIICEKPTAMSAKEAFEMNEEAKKHNNLVTIIDHELRFLPSFKLMLDYAQNKIGDVFWIEGEFSSGTRLTNMPWNWWNDKSKGGGLLGAVGSHIIDALHFITNKKITEVHGFLHTHQKEKKVKDSDTLLPVTADEIFTTQLKVGSSTFGIIKANALQSGDFTYKITICGSLGSITWNTGKVFHANVGEKKSQLIYEDVYDSDPALNTPWGHGTVLLAEALKCKLMNGDPNALSPAATFEDGLYIQRVIDAIQESNSSHNWVTVQTN